MRELASLKTAPAAQAAFAARLVAEQTHPLVLEAALGVLGERPQADSREALIAQFQRLAADGKKRDPGGFLRTAILAALGRIALPHDLHVFELAAATKEPSIQDSKGPAILRAAAVVEMNRVNEAPATLWAARLLGEGEWTNDTGEPALSAVRVLATNEQLTPVLLWAMSARGPAELVAECLRALAQFQYNLIQPFIERCAEEDDDLVALGLADLLATRKEDGGASAVLAEQLEHPKSIDVFRYQVAAIVAGRGAWQTMTLVGHAENEFSRPRLEVLDEHLPLAPQSEAVAAAATLVKGRLGARGRR